MSRLATKRKIQRMIRRDEKKEGVGLNLVSLIDVFTVLVFFLLLTSSSVETIPTPHGLTVPNSVSTTLPPDAPVIIVSDRDIEIGGHVVMLVTDAEKSQTTVLPELRAALLQSAQAKKIVGGKPDSETRGEVNILADEHTPFNLLQKVMATCGDASYARISLTVNRHGKGLPL
jgi:biopolymer transport protein ExbD